MADRLTATEAEIAWAAGLFEGEGSCFVSRRQDRPVVRIGMTMRMADRDVVERFHRIVGVGQFTGPIVHIRKTDGKRLKDVFEWRTGSWHVINDLYVLFKPWLADRRRGQFELALTRGRPKSPVRRRTCQEVTV